MSVHLVLGDVAAGVLREAMDRGTVPAGRIVRFRDIYCVGPLRALGSPAGAASRAAYWARLLPDSPPAAADFEEEEARYAAADGAGVAPIAWTGAHSSSQLWLQRLCAQLAPRSRELRLIDVTASGGRRALGQFEPRELRRLLARERPLAQEETAGLAAAWQENRSVDSGVRRWVDGRISHHPDDFYDRLLLAQCDAAWRLASEVVGGAQWACDEFLGDVFFAWRLRCLAQAGLVEWEGRRTEESAVRRTRSG